MTASELKGKIFDIKRFAIHDGPGIRTTVFMHGCPLNCWWCHNPESIRKISRNNSDSESNDKFDSACGSVQDPLLTEWTVEKLFGEIQKDKIFFEESGGGVTLSGGEPMLQYEFLQSFLEECRNQDIHTVVDTSGYVPYQYFASINDYVDLYLYDLKIIDEEEHKKFTGVSNKLIIDNLKKPAKSENTVEKEKTAKKVGIDIQVHKFEKEIPDLEEQLIERVKYRNLENWILNPTKN